MEFECKTITNLIEMFKATYSKHIPNSVLVPAVWPVCRKLNLIKWRFFKLFFAWNVFRHSLWFNMQHNICGVLGKHVITYLYVTIFLRHVQVSYVIAGKCLFSSARLANFTFLKKRKFSTRHVIYYYCRPFLYRNCKGIIK